jgi:hypothetical protein
MQIDQRCVATISLQHEPKREVYIHPDGRGFRLCLVAKDEVVNVILSAEDLRKLRRALGACDSTDCPAEFAFAESQGQKRVGFHSVPNARSAFAELDELNWKDLDWLSFN